VANTPYYAPPKASKPFAQTKAKAKGTPAPTIGGVLAGRETHTSSATPGYNPAVLDQYLRAHSSPLAGLGSVFVATGAKYGLDPRFLVAITGAETSYGTTGNASGIRNPFGLGPGMRFPSWEAAIDAAGKNLSGKLYKGSGLLTIPQIQGRWAPSGASNDPSGLNSNWTRNVSANYRALGGDPTASVFGGATAAPAGYQTQLAVGEPTPPSAPPFPTLPGPHLSAKTLGLIQKWVDDSEAQALKGVILPIPTGVMSAIQQGLTRPPMAVPKTTLTSATTGSDFAPDTQPLGTFHALRGGTFQLPGLPTGASLLRQTGTARSPGGDNVPLTTFDGKPIGQWMGSVLQFARAHGWKGRLSSGYRTMAEQQALFAKHPDPKWVATPGHSPHQFAFAADVTDGPGLEAVIRQYHIPLSRYAPEGWHFEPLGFRVGSDAVRFF